MSSVVIAGNTSGTVTLDAPNVAGTTVLTLPTTSGTVLASNSATTLNSGASAMSLQTNNGITAMTIDTSQRVGIGTASPGYLLNVSGNGGGGDSAQFVRITDTNTSNSIGPLHLTIGAANHFASNPSPVLCGTNGIAFGVGDGSDLATQRIMTIDSNGNVLIGASGTILGAKSLLVANLNSVNGFTVKDTGTTGGAYCVFLNSANAVAGSINHNGTTTVLYVTTSDYRLKENIAPMTGALDKVLQLKPVTYTWKNTDGEQGEGFIAHELAEVCPLAVSGKKDEVNEDGLIKPQGIDTSFLVATLTAAIQELKAELDTVKAELATLKGAA